MKWPRFNMPLYWRLLAWFCAANLLALVLGGMLAQRYIGYATAARFSWATLARNADSAYARGGQPALAAWAARQRKLGVEATLIEHGKVLYPIDVPPKLRAQLPAWLASGRNLVRQPWPQVRVAVQEVAGPDGQSRQLLAISRGQPHLRRIARARIFLTVDLLLSLVFIGVVGWWVARSVARPVEALRRASQRMASGELSARVGGQGNPGRDELGRLAGDFDVMAERIEALVAHSRRVLQDLSHELRSPLARLRLAFDLARSSAAPAEAARYLDQAEHEIVGLDQMLGQMLELSRMENGLPGAEHARVDLGALAHECVEQAQLEAAARGLELHVIRDDPMLLDGSAVLLQRALDNLVSNAVKFSPSGGRVDVSVRGDRGCAVVSVRDHGPGVPEGELANLCQPFFRGSNARLAAGHGLGLAIVQRVVQAHGGTVDPRNAEGGGLEVSLRFPFGEASRAHNPTASPAAVQTGDDSPNDTVQGMRVPVPRARKSNA